MRDPDTVAPAMNPASTPGSAHSVTSASDGLLHRHFERQACRHPERLALECAERKLTYGELEVRANQLARLLRDRGAARGSFVGLWLPRSADAHLALLAILKSGAAYVPLDPDYPPERVAYILGDCGITVLVTTANLRVTLTGFCGQTVLPERDLWEIERQSGASLSLMEAPVTAADLCYVIYTSGTTGRPKGVMIEHRSAAHLVQAEADLFRVAAADRVFQGFSIAFDASVEEIWLAWAAGATLVVGTRELIQQGPQLARQLAELGVTVWSTVPTLLSMQEADPASVRLLILGGESCSDDLARRWCRPGRRMVNTYGPTEATVIATFSDCAADKPVTLGRAVPGYHLYVLDGELRAVSPGTAGELCIGGVGVARGYVDRPDLTTDRFVPNPFPQDATYAPRLYRTGDLVRLNSQGELEFLGRTDDQVKIRGFRVELSEIESVLRDCPGVRGAAVALREDSPGVQQLVGYVVPQEGLRPAEAELRQALRQRLPAYMTPGLIEVLAKLPTLPSGKLDRKRLPLPQPREAPRAEGGPPRSPLETKITLVWKDLFRPAPVAREDDFFLDLGGHSLLAARMVSEVRRDPACARLAIGDVYACPTIAQLAAKLEQEAVDRSEAAGAGVPAPACFHPPSKVRHFVCGTMQCLSLYLLLGFFALQWMAPYLSYTWMIEEEYSIPEALLAAFTSLVAIYPLMLLVTLGLKWIIIGRYKAGDYPLWGFYYFRIWLANSFQSAVPLAYLAGTPLLTWYYRLLGARIGENVYLGNDAFGAVDLVSVGDGTSIGTDTNLSGHRVENGLLRIGSVHLGRNCFVGTRAVLGVNSTMEDGARLEDLSLLPEGGIIPRGETWVGSPARPVRTHAGAKAPARAFEPAGSERRPSGWPEANAAVAADQNVRAPSATVAPGASSGPGRRAAFALLHAVGLLLFPTLVIAAIFPGIIAMNELNYRDDYYWYLLLAPAVGLSFVVLLSLEIAALKWFLLGRVKAGHYPVESGFYVRKWFVDQTMMLSLDVLGPLYASVYLAPWYRLLGARLGRRAEISTASFISPDLLEIGEESFIADSVSLGAARVEGGIMTIAENRIGKRSFIGNSALLPPGTTVADDCLIGCQSVPPETRGAPVPADTAWVGSPAIFLPQRQKSTAFSAETTFQPSRKLFALRAAIELVRIVSPSAGFVALTSLLFSVIVLLQDELTPFQMVWVFPVLYAGCACLAVAITVAAKWVLVGRYRPGERPLWSTFVWRNELVTALQEHFANLFLVEALTGTPFVCWYFRLLGARIGRRVFMETTDLTEYDLVRIGDEAVLNDDCTIQTHLFEDRVMKMSTIEIEARGCVGSNSLVLYDTRMEAGATLGPLSLLMKGETLPSGSRWLGSPARAEESVVPTGRS